MNEALCSAVMGYKLRGQSLIVKLEIWGCVPFSETRLLEVLVEMDLIFIHETLK